MMAIKVFRVQIEGFVVSQDFGGSSREITPADWGLDALVEAMGGDFQLTETLVDTIPDINGPGAADWGDVNDAIAWGADVVLHQLDNAAEWAAKLRDRTA
jgi:hypothetical protein